MPNQEAAKVLHVPSLSVVEQRSIGGLLIDSGRLRPEDGEKVLRYARERGLRFGDAAIALKLATEEDIQLALSQQFDYPYLTAGQSNVTSEVVAAWSPFNAQVEQLRAIRSQLLLRWFSDDLNRKRLAVVSQDRGDGRSYIAANLAVVFSQMGERTLLIDANLRQPRQHQLFGLPNSSGLSTILAERADISAIQRVPAFVHLCVLTSGATPPNPLELLTRSSFDSLTRGLSEHFDIIIVDTPSASSGSDCFMLARKCGGVLAVARRHKTKLGLFTDTLSEVVESGATVVGSLLNEP